MHASLVQKWRPWLAVVAAPLCFALQLKLSYPGTYLVDSQDQLDQALTGAFNDWHPPAMAYFWRWLIGWTGTPASLFIFQTACYWLAIGLIADGLVPARRPWRATAILAVGMFPFFLYVSALLVKDSQMGAALLLAFALLFWFRHQGRAVPPAIAVLAGALLAYAILVRINAAFAVAPLLLYYRRADVQRTVLKKMLICCAVTPLVLGAASAINHYGFKAHHTQPIRSLQIFDIFGVAKYSGDRQWIEQLHPISAARLEHCYTPYWWDSVAPWGSCPEIAATVMNQEFKKITSDRDVYPASAKLTGLWLNSIKNHPLAYAEHRIKHFNAELNFFVPALVRRFGRLWYTDKLNARDIRDDYLKKNFLTWPALWLALAVLTLVCSRRSVPARTALGAGAETVLAAQALALSGLLYGMAYLVIGVAAEARYMYWTMLSSFIGAALCAPAIARALRARDRLALASALTVVLVILAGMLARVLDLSFAVY
jgi:hypothetical protein